MRSGNYLFTSESVAEGHPDKVADRISDEILDATLWKDAHARVAIETLVTEHTCIIAGEVHGPRVDYAEVARNAIRDIGYGDIDFDWQTVKIQTLVHAQSAEIGLGVEREGAGDQGLMFGYACRETPSLMPAPIYYAHRIVERLAALRKAGRAKLGPDAKSQVTLAYENGKPVRAHTIVVSQMHDAKLGQDELRALIQLELAEIFPPGWLERSILHVNPAGSFVRGGPAVDTGLTGRKIIVDSYGGSAPHGGGAFSGKDPTKVDRSAAYAARWLAKNVVAAELADRCTIQLAYAIGVAEPLALYVDLQGTGRVDEERITQVLRDNVSLTPRAIRERLGLNRPIYARTAAYGHFGREPQADGGFSWERTDLVPELRRLLG